MSQNKRRFRQFQDITVSMYPELYKEEGTLAKTVTFQVTDECNLACTYCYQINKGVRRMSIETAKKFVDFLLDSTPENNSYINPVDSPFIIIDFIGGEPLLEIDLIDEIITYFKQQTVIKHHPWATKHMFSICSNGTLYFNENVQRVLNKHKNRLSFSITIDGNKELHDSCRVFHDGRPSYDLAVAGAKDWMDKGGAMGSKITLAPANLKYAFTALTHMVELGYEDINANCVYEDGWTIEHATLLYKEMKKFADYMLEHKLYNVYCSLFEEGMFKPKAEDDISNWCGGTGAMLACDPDGYLYPCIRYMESSLGTDQPPLRIGHVDTGIETTQKERDVVKCLNCITRRTQSTDECFYCPIADGCAWCSAYNYQMFGTADKRATYICDMHKARSLANVYYWNKYYKQRHSDRQMAMYCPKEWAIPIIGEEEYNMLVELTK